MRAKLQAQATEQQANERKIFRLEAELRISRQRQLATAGGGVPRAAEGEKGGVQASLTTPRGGGRRAVARHGESAPLAAKENSGETWSGK